ncbi:MAG: topoisomerase C-terminal repeat-containing protein [Actinomycetaceae bacterium]|nr:topoisomerase C-terminal repeat-containing protein [Actinomycetaceae bacterium]
MKHTVIVAEKPSVARQIAAALAPSSQRTGFSDSPLASGARSKRRSQGTVLCGSVSESCAVITSARGHLVDVGSPKVDGSEKRRWTLVPKFNLFPLEPRNESGAKAQLALLVDIMHAAANNKDPVEIVNACDAGREGELIFYLIAKYALGDRYEKLPAHMKFSRLWLQGMRDEDIRQAWNERQPANRYEGLLASARCRRAADWMAGINASSTLGFGAHVGRVQTPTLAFIVERQRQIDNFKAQIYKRIVGTFAPRGGDDEVQAVWTPRKKDGEATASTKEGDGTKLPRTAITDPALYKQLMEKFQAAKGAIVPYTSVGKGKQQWAAPLFNLASLQRAANKQLGLTAAKTLEVAQSLYEAGAISYPRTESSGLPDGYSNQITKWMQQLRADGASDLSALAGRALDSGWVHEGVTLGAKKERLFDTSKISDHYAIVPLRATSPDRADKDAKALFEIIVRRTLAVFFPVSWTAEQKIIFEAQGEQFEASAKRIATAGWQECFNKKGFADGQADFDPKSLDGQSDGQATFVSVRGEDKKTTPPAPYTDADLIAKMERAGTPVAEITDDEDGRIFGASFTGAGIGTAATRAAIIERLISAKKPYAKRQNKAIVPTDDGMRLIALLERAQGAGRSLCDPEMTSEMERNLYQVSLGRIAESDFMSNFCEQTKAIVCDLETLGARKEMEAAPALTGLCPACHGDVGLNDERIRCTGDGCNFSLFRKVAGYTLQEGEIADLLRNMRTQSIDGFVAKSGKPFSAALKLVQPDPNSKDERRQKWWSMEFDFQAKPSGHAGLEVAPALTGLCPACHGDVGLNDERIRCTGDGCNFSLFRKVAGHTLQEGEIADLLRNMRTQSIGGFVAKSGKPFSAALKLVQPDPNSKDERRQKWWSMEFDFQAKPSGHAGYV